MVLVHAPRDSGEREEFASELLEEYLTISGKFLDIELCKIWYTLEVRGTNKVMITELQRI